MRRVLCGAIGLVCILGLVRAPNAEDFFRTIRTGDLDALRNACANSVNVRDRQNTTPLHYAARYGSAQSVRILLDHGADVNTRDQSEATPLIYGAGNFEKTRLLVEKGADVNARSINGVTALLTAASVQGNSTTVRYLLEKGADSSKALPSATSEKNADRR